MAGKSESERPAVHVHWLPSLIGPGVLRGGVAVVVDVLRATTVMTRALASGCESIAPCLEVEEARAIASTMPRDSVILAGEREGLPIPGFDLGNSPSAFTPELCRGKTVVMTTTNGTRAVLASLDAERVFIAAFPNLGATVKALSGLGRDVHVVCSGTDGHISLEDATLAGAIVSGLDDSWGGQRAYGNDESEIALGLWVAVHHGLERGTPLAEALSKGRGGRRVRAIGLAADIEEVAKVDTEPLVAELAREPLRVKAVLS